MNRKRKIYKKKGSDYPRFDVRLRTEEEKEWLNDTVEDAKKILQFRAGVNGKSITKKQAVLEIFRAGIDSLKNE